MNHLLGGPHDGELTELTGRQSPWLLLPASPRRLNLEQTNCWYLWLDGAWRFCRYAVRGESVVTMAEAK